MNKQINLCRSLSVTNVGMMKTVIKKSNTTLMSHVKTMREYTPIVLTMQNSQRSLKFQYRASVWRLEIRERK